jgi:3-methyladenine DNA glycosylase/8-oxoguanine DNA glycosylase
MTVTQARREIRADEPVNLRLTLGPLRQGRSDPCTRFADGGIWRATRTPEGPVTTFITEVPEASSILCQAWGPGSDWALDRLPALVGAEDDAVEFAALIDSGKGVHPVVRRLHRQLTGLRMAKTGAVTEFAVPTVLAQKVTGMEAKRSYRDLVLALGEPAPGPGQELGLRMPPAPHVLASTPTWVFHRAGVERKRADTIRHACSYAHRLEETVDLGVDQTRRRLRALPGFGPWSEAEIVRVTLGDADAVSLGDFHLPNQVAWALTGQPRGDDTEMLALLEPYRGHRGRVQRLIEAGGVTAPRYGPRLSPAGHRNR